MSCLQEGALIPLIPLIPRFDHLLTQVGLHLPHISSCGIGPKKTSIVAVEVDVDISSIAIVTWKQEGLF
jgi:hypothetical protein